MPTFTLTRPTIYDVPADVSLEQFKALIPDAALRRHLSWGMDFDSRALSLADAEEHWDEEVKKVHNANQKRVRRGLIAEYGKLAIDAKIDNFRAIDTKPMSVLAYHNQLYEQVRDAFVWANIIRH